jgi:glycosyltransferase involved in cell wall biosynthesis
MKYRFHHLAIPHTITHTDYVACAYTQKVLKFARMMTDRGHHVIHYGHADSAVVCSEHVTVTDRAVLQAAYGDHDWRRHQFKHNTGDYANQEFIRRCIPEIQSRVQEHDFVLANWGIGHQAICESVPQAIAVEPGVGYTTGHFARWRAYESHAVRNTVEGMQNPQNWYSRVIPNYFDPADFAYQEHKDKYVLFLGRVSELKGISTCIQATAAAGVQLKIAGQGRIADSGWTTTPDHVEELGYADVEMRRQLMANAEALIIATTYNEPFGGVVVEALLSGTPIITPHFGAFAEIQQPGITGFLCHTLRDYVQAIKNVSDIDPHACRLRGMQYSLDNVAPQFESWFADIREMYTGAGWMQL